MPKKKIRYPEKPYIPDPVVRAKLQALIDQGKQKQKPWEKVKWQLWRWDTLEDVRQD